MSTPKTAGEARLKPVSNYQVLFIWSFKHLAATGKDLFGQKCTACHKTDARYIGPSLKGIYDRRNPAWVMNIMLNPTEMIKKDPIAIQLLKDYNNVVMYNQNLTFDEARALAEYFRDL